MQQPLEPVRLSRRQYAFFCIALAAWICLLRFPFFIFDPFSWDEGLYWTIAQQMSKGARLYVDVWDNKPIGIFLIYSGLIKLFGDTATAISLGSALAVYATSLLLQQIINRGPRELSAGIAAAFVFPTYMLDIGAGGANTENFFIVLAAGAVLVVVAYVANPNTRRSPVRVGFLFGLIEGASCQIKFLTVIDTAALGLSLAYFCWIERRYMSDLARLAVAFALGYTVCTLLAFLHAFAIGTFDEMIFSNFISPRLYINSPTTTFTSLQSFDLAARRASYYWPLIAACVAYATYLLRRSQLPPRAPALFVLCIWCGAAFLESVITGKFSYHYFIVLAPALSTLGSVSAIRMSSRWLPGAWQSAVLATVLLTAHPLYLHSTKTLTRARLIQPSPDWLIAERTAAVAQPGSSVYIVDQSPEIYALAHVTPATRFPFPYHIVDQPWLYGVDPQKEIARIFASHPAIVEVSPNFLADRNSAVAPVIAAILARDYRQIEVIREGLPSPVLVYARNR